MHSPEQARRVIEAAMLGISGAATTRDMDYACQRHEELLAAAGALVGLDLPIFYAKIGRLLLACARGDKAGAERLALEITRFISFSL